MSHIYKWKGSVRRPRFRKAGITTTPPRVFLDSPEKCGICPLPFFRHGQIPENQVPSKLRIATENATVNTFRPVERTYSTKITRFRRPQTATFRFNAHQACILYHKSPQIARVIYRSFRRNLHFLKPSKYTSCTKTAYFGRKKGFETPPRSISREKSPLFLKKINNYF